MAEGGIGVVAASIQLAQVGYQLYTKIEQLCQDYKQLETILDDLKTAVSRFRRDAKLIEQTLQDAKTATSEAVNHVRWDLDQMAQECRPLLNDINQTLDDIARRGQKWKRFANYERYKKALKDHKVRLYEKATRMEELKSSLTLHNTENMQRQYAEIEHRLYSLTESQQSSTTSIVEQLDRLGNVVDSVQQSQGWIMSALNYAGSYFAAPQQIEAPKQQARIEPVPRPPNAPFPAAPPARKISLPKALQPKAGTECRTINGFDYDVWYEEDEEEEPVSQRSGRANPARPSNAVREDCRGNFQRRGNGRNRGAGWECVRCGYTCKSFNMHVTHPRGGDEDDDYW
ncbi:unnamed protein product [Zymoseptoria tritici ST99CH_1E4]|uniref:Fungal N-terminal domain-containing protein n=1 Tax=Zymoseptoria tritici ST99CH_1E4 TaxID=1276532 RepID=A0A2H1GTQ1_ZYMTR|nr:unnamed protein product [Zymoseptoria tritici ST99CH_1E4]